MGRRPIRRNSPHARLRAQAGARPAVPLLLAATFGDVVRQHALRKGLQLDSRTIDILAGMPYEVELGIKTSALAEFWRANRLDGAPEPLLPSPLARQYRTTTKRRVIPSRGNCRLAFDKQGSGLSGSDVAESPLEPGSHLAIYRWLSRRLNGPDQSVLARSLNWVVIRGTYEEAVVILNVHDLNAAMVRKLKSLAQGLRHADPSVAGVSVFYDPSRSDYYLESAVPVHGIRYKRLFGHERLRVVHAGTEFLVHPLSFSQVNQSMVVPMLKTVRDILEPDNTGRLVDLYCGYGLFAHFLRDQYREVLGIDASRYAVDSAVETARRFAPGRRMRFVARPIDGASLKRLPAPSDSSPAETIILDPPRGGTESSVIEALADRDPAAILHIFCNVDAIPWQVRCWERNGYAVGRVVPLDMFPGTPNLEVLVLLEPQERSAA